MAADVLHLLGTAGPEGSGIVRIVTELAAGLDPAKYRLHACFLGSPGPLVDVLQQAGVQVHSVAWTQGAADIVGLARFWSTLRDNQFAIVHQHFGARSVRWVIRNRTNARLIVHLHARVTGKTSPAALPAAVRNADVVIAPSRAIASQIPAANPITIYAGIRPSEHVSRKGSVSGCKVVIGTASRLVAGKGIQFLIHAFSELKEQKLPVELQIAGSGQQSQELQELVSRRGLQDSVCFLGWQPELQPLLSQWDIYASPSLDEAFPIATLEAMGEGLPVVATAVGGVAELVEEGQTGFLVPAGDAAALQSRLEILINDESLRRRMGRAAREIVLRRFSAGRMVDQIANIYDSLLR